MINPSTSFDTTLWRLERGRAMSLPRPLVPASLLRVREGRLWLTAVGTAKEQAADVWLGPGDEIRLPDGHGWIAEGWPTASFQILMAPPFTAPATKGVGKVGRLKRWFRSMRRGVHAQ